MNKLVALLVFCILSTSDCMPQCCSPGNPIGGTGNLGILEPKTLKLITNYNYSYSGKYYEGSKPMEPYFVKTGYFNYVGIRLVMALSNRLITEMETGYFINKVQSYTAGIIPQKKQGYGITNISFIAKLNLFRSKKKDFEITSGIGIKFPMGSFNKLKYQGGILPLDIQPSTGAADLIHTLFIYKEILEKHWRFFLSNRIEIKGTNPDGYNYGNLYATSIFASYNKSRLYVIMQLRSEIREKDERPAQTLPYEKIKIPVSGSRKIFISPQISYSIKQTLIISGIIDIPVYQYYNKQQLGSSYAFSLNISKKFKPKKA